MLGYYKNPEESRRAQAGGWHHTGDVGYRDEEGYFFLVDRTKDMIIRGGENIYPREIEDVLLEHDNVKEAAVVGRPDDFKGQALCAFVTVVSGIRPDDQLREELKAWVGKEIGSLAKPDTIRFASGLPKTRSGKIMRRILKEIAAGGAVKGDTTTLEDFSVVAALQQAEE